MKSLKIIATFLLFERSVHLKRGKKSPGRVKLHPCLKSSKNHWKESRDKLCKVNLKLHPMLDNYRIIQHSRKTYMTCLRLPIEQLCKFKKTKANYQMK